MATFNTPFNTPPKKANKKELFITLGIIAALVVATLGYYFWPKSSSPTNETPPSITISTPKFQGLISGDIVCQIPGMYEFTDSAVSGYKMPGTDSDPNWNNLEQGIHMYHSIQPIYVKEIIDLIKPVAGNKIMIAYYPSDDGNISKKFAIYPELPDQTKITDPASYLIPGDQGFAIFSCKDTKIWKVKTEKMTNDDISGLLKGKTKGWILLAATDKPLTISLDPYKNKIKSIWLQKDAGFEFQKAASLESATLVGDYKMVWLKIGPEQAATPTKPENQIACEKKCGTCAPGSLTNSYVCNNLPWGNGTTGYSCWNGLSGGTQCGIGNQPGYSNMINYCNVTGGYYNYSGCLNSEFNSGSGYYSGLQSGKPVEDSPANKQNQPSSEALSPKISVSTAVASSSAQTSTIDFTYTITGPTSDNTITIWTWGDGQSTTNKTGTLASGQTLTSKQSHSYSISQKVYNYSTELKNPDKNIILAIVSDTVNVAGAVNEKQTIASLNTTIGNHFPGFGGGKTEVIFNYRVNGDYLKPFDKVIWDFGDNNKKTEWGNNLFVNSDEKLGHSYSQPGTYNYSLTLQDDKGTEIAKKTGTITLKKYDFNIKPATVYADYCYETNPDKGNINFGQNTHYELKWQKPLGVPNQGAIYFGVRSDTEKFAKIEYKSSNSNENYLKVQKGNPIVFVVNESNPNQNIIAYNFGPVQKMTVVAVDEKGNESEPGWKSCVDKPPDPNAVESNDPGIPVN